MKAERMVKGDYRKRAGFNTEDAIVEAFYVTEVANGKTRAMKRKETHFKGGTRMNTKGNRWGFPKKESQQYIAALRVRS